MQTFGRFAAGLWLTLAALVSAGERTRYDPAFYEPSEAVVTPHIVWQKPLAGGPVRVLFLTHRNAMREVVELAQRLALDYRVFACESPSKFGETGLGVDASWRLVRGNSAEELAERLRKDLETRYDVIVAGNVKWDSLPIECRYEILRQVKAGAGFVGALSGGRDEYLGRLLGDRRFLWNWGLWSGASQGIQDYFGIGRFEGARDFAAAHGGRASLRITGTEVRKGSREAPRGGFSPGLIQLEPETDYVFSMWTRTEGLPARGAQVSLHPLPFGVPVPPSGDWVRTEFPFRTGPGNPGTGVYLLNYQVGTVWFDDVALTRAGDERNLLPNPGFENPGPAPAGIAPGVPFAGLPAFANHPDADAFAADTLETASFGRGRLALVTFPVPLHQMLTPAPGGRVQDCRLDYDYYLAFAAKVILWGAGRTPAVRVLSPDEPRVVRSRAELAARPVPFRLRAEAAFAGGQAEVCVRDRRGRLWHRDARPLDLPAGETETPVALPALPQGAYFVDLWVRQGSETVDFGSLLLEVNHPLRLGAVSLARESFALREPLTGTIAIEGFEPGCSLRLAAVDLYGRRVAEQVIPAASPREAFSLPMPAALTLAGRLEVELVQGGEVLSTGGADFTVSNLYPDRQDALFVMWENYPNDFIGPLMAQAFTDNGIEAQYGGAQDPGYCPCANQWWIPYAIRFTDRKTDWYQERPTRQTTDLVRDPCLTDPAYRESVRESLLKTARAALRSSTSDFTLGDENLFVSGTFDLCFSPTCTADFRRWAREQYPDLAALNAAWGTNWASWDEVRPFTLEEARQAGNLAPWVAHRRHMESVWAGIHAFSRDVIREVVPDARVGYEGSDTHVSTYLAADYWKLSRAMDLNNIYYRDFLSLAWRDFAAEGMLLGAGWFGGYPDNRNEPFMRWFPWRTLFKGANSFWVWCGYGNAGSVMAFDLSLYPFFAAACQEVAEIKAGPAKLLITAERAHDGVAVLYSAASVHVATATPGFPDMDATLNAAVRLMHDLGVECRVLSYEELAAGRLAATEFRLLVLPGAQALSRAEADAVRAFVAAGGHVLADLRPGVADANGRPWPGGGGVLDDVFGVRHAAPFSPQPATLAEAGLQNLVCDAGVRLAGGVAMAAAGEAPLMVTNAFGQGRATLLNFGLAPYANLPRARDVDFADWPAGEPWRRHFAQLVAGAGVRGPVRFEPELPRVEVSRFRSGAIEYLGIIQGLPRPGIEYTNQVAPQPRPQRVALRFDRSAWVYDVRAGAALGQTAETAVDMTPGVAMLFALMPYRTQALEIAAPPAVRRGGETTLAFTVRAEAGTPGRHVVRVQFEDPSGTPCPPYARNVLCEAGRGELTMTFALNDPPGPWRVTARDVATGTAASAVLQVQAQ